MQKAEAQKILNNKDFIIHKDKYLKIEKYYKKSGNFYKKYDENEKEFYPTTIHTSTTETETELLRAKLRIKQEELEMAKLEMAKMRVLIEKLETSLDSSTPS